MAYAHQHKFVFSFFGYYSSFLRKLNFVVKKNTGVIFDGYTEDMHPFFFFNSGGDIIFLTVLIKQREWPCQDFGI